MEYGNLESIYHSAEIAKPTQLTLHAALDCASGAAVAIAVGTGGLGSGISGAMMTAAATTAATTTTIAATNASMNKDGDIFKQIKDINKDAWDASTSRESVENIAIAAAVAGAAYWAVTATGGEPSMKTGSYENSKVGVNVVEENGILYEELSPGVANTNAKVDMANYNRMGGYGSKYNNNPILKILNSHVNGFESFADFHDASMTNIGATSGIVKIATIPPWLLTSYCASSPELCSIIINDQVK